MLRVIICEDQAIVRDGLEMFLNLKQDIEVVGLAQDGSEATRRIRTRHPGIKVLVLTTYNDDDGSSTPSALEPQAIYSRTPRAKR
jgi:DNA-binding NarL/FixJ family response regulator